MTEQEKREKVIAELEQCLCDSVVAVVPADTVRDALALLKAQEPIEARLHLCESCTKEYPECDATIDGIEFGSGISNDNIIGCSAYVNRWKAHEPITGETSDGYHTFNELYHHRAVLFSVIVANYPDRAWKSKKHHDGTMYDNMFIVGIDTPDGQATYHYDIDPYWDMFRCRELDNAPEWDGHTSAQAIERIGKLKAQEPHVIRFDEIDDYEVLWLEVRDVGTEEGLAPWVKTRSGNWFSPLLCSELQPDMILSTPEEYGKYCRCWTSRPTDERRKAVKWE